MNVRRFALLACVALAVRVDAQAPQPAAPGTTFYMASYVEVVPASRAGGLSALKAYRESVRALDGAMRVELFEQTGEPGHFVMIESWRDQQRYLEAATAARTRLLDALKTSRQSGWDERPYKTLTVEPPTAGRSAVWVISHVDVSPDPKVASLLRQLAEASRKEAGNLRFDVLQHTQRANHFTVIEGWRDRKALDAHAAAAHTKEYREGLQPFLGSPLDQRVFVSVE